MKSYQEKELKYYVISCIFIFLWVHFDNNSETINLWVALEPLLISPAFYIFTILFDSIYSSNMKFKLVHLGEGLPSEKIFTKIQTKDHLPWFTSEHAKSVYSDLYKSMPTTKQKSKSFQSGQWYKIYIKYRDKNIKALDVSAKEYRMLRDIYISTVNLIFLYITYCIFSKDFYMSYLSFLLISMIITNIAARNKGKTWVYNVIAHDINNLYTNEKREEEKEYHDLQKKSTKTT